MLLGSDVDNYLTNGENYNHDNADIIRPIAVAVKQRIGVLYKYLVPQLSFTADFVHSGFKLAYKGRSDLAIKGRLVIDIKVSEMPLAKSIQHFGYDNQLNGYAAALEATAALIFSVNPKTKIVTCYNVPLSHEWWEYQILQKGEPIL